MDLREDTLERYRDDFKSYKEWLKDQERGLLVGRIVLAISLLIAIFFVRNSINSIHATGFIIIVLILLAADLKIELGNKLKDAQYVISLKQEKQLDEIIFFLRDIKYNTLSQQQKNDNIAEHFPDEVKDILLKTVKG